MKKIYLFLLALTAVCLFSCQEGGTETIVDFEEAELSIAPESVNLANAANSSATTTITSDQTVFCVTVDYQYKTWLSAEISGTTVTVKAIAANEDTTERVGTVTIVAGEKGVTATKVLTVTQAAAQATTLSLSATSVDLTNKAASTATVTATTNASFTATVDSASATWCGVSVSGNVITLTALADNEALTPRTAVVTVVAGKGTNTVTKTFNVVQAEAESLTPTLILSTNTVSLEKEADSSKTVDVTSNQDAINVAVNTEAQTWCEATISNKVITIKAISANSNEAARTATVTVTAATLSETIAVEQKGTPASYIGTVQGEGVVFWQDPDNVKRVKIISGKRVDGQVWSATKTETGATNADDGVANTNTLKGQADWATNNYAAKVCVDMGEGWYMPTANELDEVFRVYNGTSIEDATNDNPVNITAAEKASREKFETALLSIAGGAKLNAKADDTAGDSIWSSCESSSDSTKAIYVRFGKYGRDGGAKTSTARTTRCVKVVTIP